MPINLFQIIFFNQYLISPKTYLHKIPNEIKPFVIFSLLLVTPYISYQYIVLLIIVSLIIILTLKVPTNYLFNFKYTLIFILLYTVNQHIYTYNAYTDQKFKHHRVHIIASQDIKQNKSNLMSSNYILGLPIYIFRGTIIYIAYLILLKVLYFTTSYEDIITDFFLKGKHFLKNFTKKNIITIIIGSNFIALLTNNMNIIIKAVALRGCHCRYSYFYALHYLCSTIYFNIKRVSSTLHYREVYSTDLNLYKFNKTFIHEKLF